MTETNNTKEYADFLKSKNAEPEAMARMSNKWTLKCFGNDTEKSGYAVPINDAKPMLDEVK